MNIEDKIKEVKGRRLFRALRRRFKTRNFKFEWSTGDTACWDGETMFIKYNISTNERPYLPEEEDIIREGFAYHEMGHRLYDDMKVYRQWIDDNSSSDEADWTANEKWPGWFASRMANIAADGRLEHAIVIDYPFTKPYIDFLNNDYCFKDHLTNEKGVERVKDFCSLLLRRSLGLFEIDGFHEDVVQLLDDNQHLIDAFINTYSTADCLAAARTFIQAIWPTYSQWLEDEQDSAEESLNHSKSSHDNSDWGDEDKSANNNRTRENAEQLASNSSPDDESPDELDSGEAVKRLLQQLARMNQQLQQEAEEELNAKPEPYRHQSFITSGLNSVSSTVSVEPNNFPNYACFEDCEDDNKIAIAGLSKVLKTILEPVPDETLNNARSGRFRPNLAWKGVKCDNMQMYRRKLNGTPKGNAYLACMADTSGSTEALTQNNVQVIQEIREALTVVHSAAHKIGLPSKAYSFSSNWDGKTTILQLKPHENKFTNYEKGAIGGIKADFANRDVVALQFLIDELAVRSEEIRVGLFISDGSPCFADGENEDTIKTMVSNAARKNIDILCLYVGNDTRGYECAKRMYGTRVILSRTSLAKDLKKQLVHIIAHRRG